MKLWQLRVFTGPQAMGNVTGVIHPHLPAGRPGRMADDNVVPAHTLRLSAALLAAGRPHQVDLIS
jgi:hypothetical protein